MAQLKELWRCYQLSLDWTPDINWSPCTHFSRLSAVHSHILSQSLYLTYYRILLSLSIHTLLSLFTSTSFVCPVPYSRLLNHITPHMIDPHASNKSWRIIFHVLCHPMAHCDMLWRSVHLHNISSTTQLLTFLGKRKKVGITIFLWGLAITICNNNMHVKTQWETSNNVSIEYNFEGNHGISSRLILNFEEHNQNMFINITQTYHIYYLT